MKAEDQLQVAVIKYIRFKYPDVLSIHVANERGTSPRSGKLLKDKGVLAGVPDILIFKGRLIEGNPSELYYGLAIELKIKPNKPTESQKQILKRLYKEGWSAHVCYTFDEAVEIIDNYLND